MFVLCHELGHYLLHHNLRIGQFIYDTFEDTEHSFRTMKRELKNPKNWIEWQANQFAASLALPDAIFLARFWEYQLDAGNRKEALLLDDTVGNQYLYKKIVIRLSRNFNVTKTSVKYKLKEMELVKDKSRLKTVGQVIDNLLNDQDA